MVDDDRARLKKLLPYWAEHNREHSREIRDWAGKARALGEVKAAAMMLRATQAMDKAGGLLSQSLKRLEE